jgi:hypothetical protein
VAVAAATDNGAEDERKNYAAELLGHHRFS